MRQLIKTDITLKSNPCRLIRCFIKLASPTMFHTSVQFHVVFCRSYSNASTFLNTAKKIENLFQFNIELLQFVFATDILLNM